MGEKFRVLILCVLLVLFVGCDGPAETQPIWKKTKVGDLAPAEVGKSDRIKPAVVFLAGFVFEVPLENLENFSNVWNMLRADPITFENAEAFKSNSFLASFGREEMAEGVKSILKLTKARSVRSLSITISDGYSNDIIFADMPEKKIYYVAKSLRMVSTVIGPGDMVLRVTAQRVPASKGVFQLRVAPVFRPVLRTSETNEVIFDSAAFRVDVSPGDFILIGSNKYSENKITLGSMFFSVSNKKPSVRIFLLACNRISD